MNEVSSKLSGRSPFLKNRCILSEIVNVHEYESVKFSVCCSVFKIMLQLLLCCYAIGL